MGYFKSWIQRLLHLLHHFAEIAKAFKRKVLALHWRQNGVMKRYLFNVQNTYVVIAESETQAQEMLDNGKAELKDRDTLLVEVTDNE